MTYFKKKKMIYNFTKPIPPSSVITIIGNRSSTIASGQCYPKIQLVIFKICNFGHHISNNKLQLIFCPCCLTIITSKMNQWQWWKSPRYQKIYLQIQLKLAICPFNFLDLRMNFNRSKIMHNGSLVISFCKEINYDFIFENLFDSYKRFKFFRLYGFDLLVRSYVRNRRVLAYVRVWL